MKRKLFTLSALALIIAGGLFWSCQKEEIAADEAGLMLKAGGSDKVDPEMTIKASQDPAINGTVVTITVSTNQSCGTIWIEDGLGQALTDKISLSGTVDSVTFTYEAEFGTDRTFVGKSNASGGGCNFNAAHTSSLTVAVIEDECSEPLTIAAELVANKTVGNWYYFVAQYEVKACEDFTSLKIQGGLTAGSELVSGGVLFGDNTYETTTGCDTKLTKKNSIISWTEDVVSAPFEKTYTVVFKKQLKGTCMQYDITGAWSAKAWHMVSSLIPVLDELNQPVLDENNEPVIEEVWTNEEVVAGYNNKLFYTTPGCLEPIE